MLKPTTYGQTLPLVVREFGSVGGGRVPGCVYMLYTKYYAFNLAFRYVSRLSQNLAKVADMR